MRWASFLYSSNCLSKDLALVQEPDCLDFMKLDHGSSWIRKDECFVKRSPDVYFFVQHYL